MFTSRDPARRAITLAAVAAAVGCSSGDSTSTGNPAPKAAMLLVTNSTCAAGHCDSIDVLAFPSYQYSSPGGPRTIDLGIVATPTACLSLPVADTIRVTATDNYGYTSTTIYTWNPLGAMTLGTITPGANRLTATSSTNGFIPANSPGWIATLPGSQETAGAACTP